MLRLVAVTVRLPGLARLERGGRRPPAKVSRHAPHRLLEHRADIARAQVRVLLEGELAASFAVRAAEE